MKKLKLDRISCHVTASCNLRCNKCSAYIPDLYQLTTPPKYLIADMKRSFQVYFEMVEHVRMISLSGGEPLLFPDLAELVGFILEYSTHFDKLELFTNGTLVPSKELLSVCRANPKISFIVDHYGPEVSTKVNDIRQSLEENQINYIIRIYHGENAHCGGWHDYCINGEKASAKETALRYETCYSGKDSKLCTIFGKRLFLCPLSEVGHRIGAIPLEDTLFMELDDDTSIEEKINKLSSINDADVNPACAYCRGSGVYKDEPRYTPGVQLKEQ